MSEQHFQERDIHYICFHYMLNGKSYSDDLGKTMSFAAFYQAMADGAETRTSQVNVDEYIAYFTSFLEQGLDILHVTLSSGISGTYNSACLARDELSAKYPERKIYVVDSLGASSGYGLLMDKLADLRDGGYGFGGAARLDRAEPPQAASLVLLYRSDLLRARWTHFQGQRLVRHDASYLPPAQHG